MKKVLEEKYDALSITSIGVALGVEDQHDDTDESQADDEDLDESRDSFSLEAGTSLPKSPMSRRLTCTWLVRLLTLYLYLKLTLDYFFRFSP